MVGHNTPNRELFYLGDFDGDIHMIGDAIGRRIDMATEIGETAVLEATGASSVLEILGTTRAMRWFTDEPVPEELIRTLVWAATRAPSAGNSQGWDFLVVTDAEKRRQVGEAIKPLLDRVRASESDPANPHLRPGSLNLMENMHRIPLLLFVCGREVYPRASPRTDMMYSALFGATQNILIAARALGLGAAMTTFHSEFEDTIRQLFGIPDDVYIGALVPIGWPARPFGPVRRKPLSEIVHRDHWSHRDLPDEGSAGQG
ncbi:nitroreductase family protein [Rhodococcus koreensis]